jgi:hypothetical protein
MAREPETTPGANTGDTLILMAVPLFVSVVVVERRNESMGARRRQIIPAAQRADWYARGVGGAAACEINKIPADRPLIEESMFRAAGITPQEP